MGLALNAPRHPAASAPAPPALPAAPPADGVQRYVWEGRYGAMQVEVVGDAIYVNGQRVEPAPR